MTFMMRVEHDLADVERAVVRLLRRYTVCQQINAAPLPLLTELGSELGIAAPPVVALASVFQLTEACLGRPLIAECCCSPSTSTDERALLLLLTRARDAGPALGSSDVPHGLPGALAWAVASTRRLLDPSFPKRRITVDQPMTRCPFAE